MKSREWRVGSGRTEAEVQIAVLRLHRRAARRIFLLGGGLHDLAVLGDPQEPVSAGDGFRGGGQVCGGELPLSQYIFLILEYNGVFHQHRIGEGGCCQEARDRL